MGYIYKLTCTETDKVYIGQTRQSIEERWYDHKQCCRRLIKYRADVNKNADIRNSYLYNAMAHYGEDTFSIEIIQEVENDFLDEFEIFYIEWYDSLVPFGLNLTTGGTTHTHSDITIAKMTETIHGTIDSRRNEILRGLPPKTRYNGPDSRGGEMIKFNNHEICGNTQFKVAEYRTIEAAHAAAMEYARSLGVVYEPSEPKPKKEKKIKVPKVVEPKRVKAGPADIMDKPGFNVIKGGYRIKKLHMGVPYIKTFISKDLTDEQNKALALAYYNEVMEIINNL